MSRAVTTSSTDQSIRVWAYNAAGVAITGEAYNSAGIAVSVVVRSAGRIVSTTALTLVARSTVGEHRDKAFTEVGAGEYVVDLEDAYFTTANRQVSVTLTSTAISGGYVLSETLDVGVRAELDSAAILAVADQVWDEATSGHTTAGTYGGRIVRATNSNTEVQITGSNHIAADVHDFQSGVITAGDFAANSITASALATDAVTEIQSGLARTGADSDTLETLSDQLDTIGANMNSIASVSREAF